MARITYRKTRRGETIDIRADKGEDLRNVVQEMAKPVPLTADTITDEQIALLFWQGAATVDLAHEALDSRVDPDSRAKARARCAEILNARRSA